MEVVAVVKELKNFIEANILATGILLTSHENLQHAGIDSFSIVEIVLFVERKYQLTIPDDQMIPENFKSLHSLALLVINLLGNKT